jgi:hypothetical protein
VSGGSSTSASTGAAASKHPRTTDDRDFLMALLQIVGGIEGVQTLIDTAFD